MQTPVTLLKNIVMHPNRVSTHLRIEVMPTNNQLMPLNSEVMLLNSKIVRSLFLVSVYKCFYDAY